MKKIYTISLLVIAMFLAVTEISAAQKEASSFEAEKSDHGRRTLQKSGLPSNISPKMSEPLVTIIPSASVKKLPRFDFLPKRMREKEEKI